MTPTVRPARRADVPRILELIVALAVYEREPDAVRATEASLEQTLFAPDASVFAFVAEQDGCLVGIALWFPTYSTWTGRPSLYLEDLFVDDGARGSGVGALLFKTLAQEAKRRNCARLDWAVLDWNEDARRFYASLGGRHATGWQPWRLEGEALDRLAED